METISLSEYINLDMELNKKKDKQAKKNIKIAILGSFTLNGLKEVINVKCHNIGVNASFYIGPYNQYIQDIADKSSDLYLFNPEITFLILDTRSIFGEIYFNPYSVKYKKRMEASEAKYTRLNSLVENFIAHGSGVLVINNLEVPTYSPIGILESREKFGYFDMVIRFNTLLKRFNRYKSIFIFDYDSFAAQNGKKSMIDDKMLYLADSKIAPDVIPLLSDEYLRYIKSLKGLTKKCLVLDMDNTVWGGIVGEDGFDGIKLGPTAPGNAYVEFQKRILALFNRGIILAINSNNNQGDVLKVLREHPDMILREHHFASVKINWENKVKNLIAIAKDLNIGLDSMIFLEDDKRTRAIVRETLPQVLCPDIPEDPSSYSRFITELRDMDSLQITPEDRERGNLYARERKRRSSKKKFNDLSEYLQHLDIVARIKIADRFSIPRISQLTLRTNQFNFSTKRYDESEIKRMVLDKRYDVYYINVKDRYGDYGIAGAIITLKRKSGWLIDTFLMSCRVLGRNIEDAVLAALIDKAIKAKVKKVVIGYSRTEKNAPVAKFLKSHGIDLSARKKNKKEMVIYQKGRRHYFSSERTGHIKVTLQ